MTPESEALRSRITPTADERPLTSAEVTGRLRAIEDRVRRDAFHEASRLIRALPIAHGGDIPIGDVELGEREAIADYLDEVSA